MKAVGIGEEIVARAEVLTVRDDKPICTLATSIANCGGRDLPVRHGNDLHGAA